MTRPTRHLVIFVKQPRLGAVKRRLAAGIGAVAAWRFYRLTAARVIRNLATDRRWRTWLAVTPDDARLPPGWSRGCCRIGQGRGDIGSRMAAPIHSLPQGPVVIVGTDIPDLDRRHVLKAFAVLGDHDIAFGPADDGGYWLIGFRRRPRRVIPFQGVRWSSEFALVDTVANLDRRVRWTLVDCLQDVDDASTYHCWRSAALCRRPEAARD